VTAPIRIGTRGSALALAQARWVERELQRLQPGLRTELLVITTTGDRFTDRPLSSLGGKGLFVKEIEDALLDGRADIAVHSMKDLPGDLAPGLTIAAVPVREDARDVVITRDQTPLDALPPGTRAGTSSLRRAALLRARWPGLEIVAMRGNVDTRLRKLEGGEVDLIVVAAAGLSRLGVKRRVEILDPADFVPAIGQGALAVEGAIGRLPTAIGLLDHASTRVTTSAERAFLRRVGGSCRTPLAAHATLSGGLLRLQGLIASPNGTSVIRGGRQGAAGEAEQLGDDLAGELLDRGGREILRALGGAP
jgi:hydroxymethylbilane synthase